MFDPNALLQRAAGDAGYRERRLALDEGRPGGAAEHIRKALNHVKGGEELDEQRLCRYLTAALAALNASEARRDRDDEDEEEFGPRPGDRRGRARDAMGEVPPRSSVSTRGLRTRVDHRRDFDDYAQDGADSRHAFDRSGFNADALLQRGATL